MAESTGWVFKPDVPTAISVDTEDEFLSNTELYEAVLSSIQDGISVLKPDFKIIYVNKSMLHWYPGEDNVLGQKCYEVFHGRTEPCVCCPTIRAVRTAAPQMDLVPYTTDGEDSGWQKLYAVPVLDKNGHVVLVIEYIRDITFQKRVETYMNELAELYENLEAQNDMLMEILNQRERYKEDLEQTITQNVEKYIRPSLNYLKKNVKERDLNIVAGLIDEIVYPITKKRPSVFDRLSPRELQVCTMIKEGYTSKEIADALFITKKTVDYHRSSIRKKLGLQNENLRVYLETHL